MSPFARVEGGRPLRLVVVGCGNMGRSWMRAIDRNSDATLVGVVDLDDHTIDDAVHQLGLSDIERGSDAVDVARAGRADAVINVTVPGAHLPVNLSALRAGLSVLCEKPAASTVAQAAEQARVAQESGRLLMISQSRRYFTHLRALREHLPMLGRLGAVTTEFFRDPRFGGFREDMDHVLLSDMAIHHFDTARMLVESDPVSVYATEYNPSWSWYRADANATAVFTFANGVRFTFSGSWCAPGAVTSWNAAWRISGEHGSLIWDGDSPASLDLGSGPSSLTAFPGPEQIDGSLAEFISCLRSGTTPDTEATRNVTSLAMVEAAIISAREHRLVDITEVLSTA